MRRLGLAVVVFVTAARLVGVGTANAAVSTLTGEGWFTASAPGTPATITGTCDTRNTVDAGNSVFTFSYSGPIDGPYPGTFNETGAVTLGPQTEEIPTAPGHFSGGNPTFR